MELGLFSTVHPEALVNETTCTVAVRPIAIEGIVSVFVTGSNEGNKPPRQIKSSCPFVISRSSIEKGGNTAAVICRSAINGKSFPVIANTIEFGAVGQLPSQTSPPPVNSMLGQLTGTSK